MLPNSTAFNERQLQPGESEQKQIPSFWTLPQLSQFSASLVRMCTSSLTLSWVRKERLCLKHYKVFFWLRQESSVWKVPSGKEVP